MSEPKSKRFEGPIGYQVFGTGSIRVIVMNDWLSDTSSWDYAKFFIDQGKFTFAFLDLRGYGRSRSLGGTYTLLEAATDVMTLADTLSWDKFVILGHSMSALVALHVAQHHPDRIERVVVLSPPPPTGFGADDAMVAALQGLALADDSLRKNVFREQFGSYLSPGWADFKVERWRAAADPVAAAGYVLMYARDGLPSPSAPISVPVLAITGEKDSPPMRQEAVSLCLGTFCSDLEVVPLADSGHYPMQEAPALTVALVEEFLAR
jgi:pimeloyl-ACP methyl ester carboxylesterase